MYVLAAAPNSTVLNEESTNDQFLEAVTYKEVPSIVKTCDRGPRSSSTEHLQADSACFDKRPKSGRNNIGRKPDHSALCRLPCNSCGKYGHGQASHSRDETIPERLNSLTVQRNLLEQQTESNKRPIAMVMLLKQSNSTMKFYTVFKPICTFR